MGDIGNLREPPRPPCARSGNCALKVAHASKQRILFNWKAVVPSQRCRGIWMQ